MADPGASGTTLAAPSAFEGQPWCGRISRRAYWAGADVALPEASCRCRRIR